MIIDLDKKEDLLLQSNKAILTEGLLYFSKITNENITNIFYNLTRTTNLKDIDIKFIITFLLKSNYIDITDERIKIKLKINSDKLIDELIFFYLSIIINNDHLNQSLFINSKFTIVDDDISINIFSVQVKHRIFFTVLQNLGLLVKTDKEGIVIVQNYTLAKKFLERPLRKISPNELENELEQKKLNGIIAEKFVLSYEKKRLGNAKVEWVAEYIVNEGYDIASFDNTEDTEYNRFIEVKSYEGKKPYFFWSMNECNIARLKKEKYWIYLINRDRMNETNYIPLMIQNPYIKILQDDKWSKKIDNYKIELKKSL
ncbi:DUF3883 domain-containing protein [Flavobacterium collinsii]|uniref:Protein NO VEIN C-terminal domain-containing protein n=1 Tax=Flavobacterium collinsii TaxID=1114861 RepID=A0A9W4XDP0_9FLAO|nr:DUF3883 domain-containing protein [Flavobacterium collinsii]CAI2766321.1 conserved protein of unknown function [Flavobacterium collinsii]